MDAQVNHGINAHAGHRSPCVDEPGPQAEADVPHPVGAREDLVASFTRTSSDGGSTYRTVARRASVAGANEPACIAEDVVTALIGAAPTPPQHALSYHGLPPTTMQTSGGYNLTWRLARRRDNARVARLRVAPPGHVRAWCRARAP